MRFFVYDVFRVLRIQKVQPLGRNRAEPGENLVRAIKLSHQTKRSALEQTFQTLSI